MSTGVRVRTQYSFSRAIGDIDDTLDVILDRVGKGGYAPITDFASSYGWVKWREGCEKRGLKPVFGVELGVTEDLDRDKPIVDDWLFLPTDNITDLCTLITLAMQENKDKPLISYEQVAGFDSIIKVMGHRTQLQNLPDMKNLCVALSPAVTLGYKRRVDERKLPWVFAGENRFLVPEDKELYMVSAGWRSFIQSYPQHLLSVDEWRKRAGRIFSEDAMDAAIRNADSVLKAASSCTLASGQLPVPPTEQSLLSLCLGDVWVSLNERLYSELPHDDAVKKSREYIDRLDHELKIIRQKGFEDYFLIVADMVSWARERMLVGPARGSAAGSLVCWLSGITNVDPIEHNLLFERFLDVSRDDMPDIDIDFPNGDARDEVVEHLKNIYGDDRVARLGTVGKFKTKASINATCAALDYSAWDLYDWIRGQGVANIENDKFPKVDDDTALKECPAAWVAKKIFARPSHMGKHAAGIIVGDKALGGMMPLSEGETLMIDKKDSEKMGLLKIDALVISQIGIIESTLKMMDLPLDTLTKLPLDKDEAFKEINERRYAGVFQLNKNTSQNYAKKINVETFSDIVALMAIARTGPIESGSADLWVKRRLGKERPDYPHEIFRSVLEPTKGAVIYQEQVMEIGRIGGLSWPEVGKLRKAMSGSKGSKAIAEFGDKWKRGCLEKGVSKETLDTFWEQLLKYGGYTFNRSHAVSYAMVCYWSAYMKHLYRKQYAASMLNIEKDVEKHCNMLRELVEKGIEFTEFDSFYSDMKWRIAGNKLVGPLMSIKGIGPAMAEEVLASRNTGLPLRPAIQKKLDNPETPYSNLYPIRSAVKKVCPDLRVRRIYTEPTPIQKIVEEMKGAVIVGAVDKWWMDKGMIKVWLKNDFDRIFCIFPNTTDTQLLEEKGGVWCLKGNVKVKGEDDFRMMLAQGTKFLGIDESLASRT